jgi:hypothetical protein
VKEEQGNFQETKTKKRRGKTFKSVYQNIIPSKTLKIMGDSGCRSYFPTATASNREKGGGHVLGDNS